MSELYEKSVMKAFEGVVVLMWTSVECFAPLLALVSCGGTWAAHNGSRSAHK